MLFVLSVVVLLAVLCYRRRRRRLGHVMAGLFVLLFLGLGCGPLANLMVYGLQGTFQVEPAVAWAPRNAIVVLGAGTVRPNDEALQPLFFASGRLLRASQLYQSCKRAGKECRLFVSGGDSQGHGEAEASVYARSLHELGIPDADVVVDARSMSTWQNAQFIRPLLERYAAQHVLLVTSGVHMRRSLLYFGHFGIVPQPVAGDWMATVTVPFPVAWNISMADVALHEYLGIARYYVYNLAGWNAPRAAPLAT
ncbi:YdcF family protein [Dyella soli]|uniref:YdcF family protein n=2 Tax=Dyella soli TaxID=522319 RepID=A0A4R0YWL5_9GAMM|nr:YdcF family protein [Dyella soli]